MDGVREVLLLGQNVNSYADGSALDSPTGTPRQHSISQASTSYYAEVFLPSLWPLHLKFHTEPLRRIQGSSGHDCSVHALQPRREQLVGGGCDEAANLGTAGLQLCLPAEAGRSGAVRGAAGQCGKSLPRDAHPLHLAAPQGLWRRRPAGAFTVSHCVPPQAAGSLCGGLFPMMLQGACCVSRGMTHLPSRHSDAGHRTACEHLQAAAHACPVRQHRRPPAHAQVHSHPPMHEPQLMRCQRVAKPSADLMELCLAGATPERRTMRL